MAATAGLFPSLDKEGWRNAPGWFDSGELNSRALQQAGEGSAFQDFRLR